MYGYDDSSRKQSTALREFLKGWFCFDYSQKQDDAEWEQDEEREADYVNEEDGDEEKQSEGNDGAIFARISEEIKDVGCKILDDFPTVAHDITKGKPEINDLIFLQNIQIIFNE